MKLLGMEETAEKDISRKKCQMVRLVPYAHQVGGHLSVMTYDDTTICKALVEGEYEFYKSLPDRLKPFTPEFKGLIDVHLAKDDRGSFEFYAIPYPCGCSSACSAAANFSDQSINDRLLQEADVNTEPDSGDRLQWNDSMQERLLLVLRKKRKGTSTKFLLLGNVAAKLTHPCVLDLKMGTRQHGTHDSTEKVEKMINVCAESTSKTLGVRLCGMQVFNRSTNKYNFVDKYVGRHLDDKGFENSMETFFHNGVDLLIDLIDPFLQKLIALHEAIANTDCYRFYACSLLLIYNGSPDDSIASRLQSIDVRMIDFAKVSQKDNVNNSYEGPDTGLLLGLETLIKILKELRGRQQ